MTNDGQIDQPVDRRFLLRGGAVLAGAAGATVLGAALAPTAANAANGDELVVGQSNSGTSTTGLTIASGAAPALSLTNVGGPSLRLNSVGEDFNGDLNLGEIVNTDFGPLVGVDYGDDGEVDYLATGTDLIGLPTPVAITPERLLDTRKASGRTLIVRRSSPTALTAGGKLKAGQWIDVAVDTAEGEFELSSIFATAAVIDPEKNGYLIVYPPSTSVPNTSNINFRTGVNLSNAVFVGLGVYAGDYVVRIWTSQTTHLLFDLSGGVVGASTQVAVAAKKGNIRATRQAKRLQRMRKSLVRFSR